MSGACPRGGMKSIARTDPSSGSYVDSTTTPKRIAHRDDLTIHLAQVDDASGTSVPSRDEALATPMTLPRLVTRFEDHHAIGQTRERGRSHRLRSCSQRFIPTVSRRAS